MSDTAPIHYYLKQVGLSRGKDDATTKKTVSTWRCEYLRFDTETGLQTAVNECEDGLLWFSPAARLPVPRDAKPSTAAEYDAAFSRWRQYDDKQEAQAAKEKQFRKQCQHGDIYGLHPERTQERIRQHEEQIRQQQRQERKQKATAAAAAASVPPAPERSESSLPQPAPCLAVVRALPEPVAVEGQLLDDFTVLDTEFIPEGSHLLEVAAVRYRNGQPDPVFQSFVRFTGDIPRRVVELTGITRREVANAPEEQVVLGLLRQYAGDSLLVAHSVGADRGVIEKTRARLGATEELPNTWLCTLALARKRRPHAKKNGLTEICHELGFTTTGAHRAERDVEMCAAVLLHFHQQQPVTKADLYGAQRASKTPKSAALGPGLLFNAA